MVLLVDYDRGGGGSGGWLWVVVKVARFDSGCVAVGYICGWGVVVGYICGRG